jgi:hypothetical protein
MTVVGQLVKRDPYYAKHILKILNLVCYVNYTLNVLRCTEFGKQLDKSNTNEQIKAKHYGSTKNRATCLRDIPTSSFSHETR